MYPGLWIASVDHVSVFFKLDCFFFFIDIRILLYIPGTNPEWDLHLKTGFSFCFLLSFAETKFLINVDKFIKHFRGIFKKSSKEKFYNKCDLEESIISEGNLLLTFCPELRKVKK